MQSSSHDTPFYRRSRGRNPFPSESALGKFIQARIKALSVTQNEMARRMGISTSRLSRFLNGRVSHSWPIDAEKWADAMELDEVNRRQFLGLMAVTSASLVLSTGMPKNQAPSYVRKKIDLEYAEGHLKALERLFVCGELRFVCDEARCLSQKLLSDFPEPINGPAASLIIRANILWGNAVEALVPWYQRAPLVIKNYEFIEESVVPYADPDSIQDSFARMLERKAPLLREEGNYERSLSDFRFAIRLARQTENIQLLIGLYSGLAHIRAVQGNEHEWYEMLVTVQSLINQLPDREQRQELTWLLSYKFGEGYKRLAYNIYLPLSLAQIKRYAGLAIKHLGEASPLKTPDRSSHALLTSVSEAQVLIWVDAREALKQLIGLKEAALTVYPALADKIQRAIEFARVRLTSKEIGEVIKLNLNHR